MWGMWRCGKAGTGWRRESSAFSINSLHSDWEKNQMILESQSSRAGRDTLPSQHRSGGNHHFPLSSWYDYNDLRTGRRSHKEMGCVCWPQTSSCWTSWLSTTVSVEQGFVTVICVISAHVHCQSASCSKSAWKYFYDAKIYKASWP